MTKIGIQTLRAAPVRLRLRFLTHDTFRMTLYVSTKLIVLLYLTFHKSKGYGQGTFEACYVQVDVVRRKSCLHKIREVFNRSAFGALSSSRL